MRKRSNLRRVMALLVVVVIMSLLCQGCATTAYACSVLDTADTVASAKQNDYIALVKIGDQEYSATYKHTVSSCYTGTRFDEYEVTTSDGTGCVRYNADTKELVSFRGIAPFERLTEIESMTEAQIKSSVEMLLKDMVDFSVYNQFTLKKINATSASRYAYRLIWQVKREVLCNISVDVSITADGKIEAYCKSDYCPEDLTAPFVTDQERDKLIWDCLQKRFDNFKPYEFRIESQTLTYYEGEEAIIYLLTVLDKEGFATAINIVITGRNTGR